jgi:hypothetical protein
MKLPAKQVRYIDLPELSETFSDSLGLSIFDGQSFRIEFCITRYDEQAPQRPATARRHPACRLVLTPETGVALLNRLRKMIEAMREKGLVRDAQPPGKDTVR